jgi:hypothetical protein
LRRPCWCTRDRALMVRARKRVRALNPGCAIEKAMLVHKGQGPDDVLNKSAPACISHNYTEAPNWMRGT